MLELYFGTAPADLASGAKQNNKQSQLIKEANIQSPNSMVEANSMLGYSLLTATFLIDTLYNKT